MVLAVAFGAILSVLSMQARTKAHRVLFAMTSAEDADWQLTLNNIRNLMSGLTHEPIEIWIVAYGTGIAFLKRDGADAAQIIKLESLHAHGIACGNAMQKQHVEASDLVAGSQVVPAGSIEIVRKQEQRWTYFKAAR